MKLIYPLLFVCIHIGFCKAQTNPDTVYQPFIGTPQLFPANNPSAMPVIKLNSSDLLELHFDDFDGNVKNYFYSFELCNANWETANLSSFDYIRGFQQQRIAQYRLSSISQTNYTHYQVQIPDRNCIPTRSGNYLLKVFLNGNINNLVFTKRFYVVDGKASIGMLIQQPFNNQFFRTHQKLQVTVNTNQLQLQNPQQQVQLVLMQNNRLDNTRTLNQPAFIRGNIIEYNGELDGLFPAGKEYRWVDLRSFRFQSERVEKIDMQQGIPYVTLKTDAERTNARYLFYNDFNGAFVINATEQINPYWQSDYGWVKFKFYPQTVDNYYKKKVYLSGMLTGNQLGDTALMTYNNESKCFEKQLFLKQGFYTYTYLTQDFGRREIQPADASLTDGNYWETENEYAAFVYYRNFSGRHDELVGMVILNSRSGERISF